MEKRQKIEISTGLIIRTVLVLLSIWFLFIIRDILAIFFVSIVVVAGIEPAINWMQKKKIPRSVGVLIIYLLLLVTVSFLVYLLISPIQSQFADFTRDLPQYLERIEKPFEELSTGLKGSSFNFENENITKRIEENVSGFVENIFSTTRGIFSGFISAIIVLTLAFYMSVKEDSFKKFISLVIPKRHQKYSISLMERVKARVGRWMQGQLFLMFIVFLLNFLGLWLIGLPHPLILAVFAGVLEVVPYVGPIAAAIPGVILGFLISPLAGMLAILVYFIVQQLENHIIAPQVMKKAVGLNPIAVILALLVGIKLGGILGAILAIPIATAISIFWGDVMKIKEKEELKER